MTESFPNETVARVESAVSDLAREHRHQLWPRVAAERAAVDIGTAREIMLDLVGAGLLYLDYVVLCPNGDTVKTTRHPAKPPIGSKVECFRCDEAMRFEVTEDDVYLTFEPTERLERLIGSEGESPPKASGASARLSGAAAPAGPSPDERASAASGYSSAKQQIIIEKVIVRDNNFNSGIVGGDQITGKANQAAEAKDAGSKVASVVVLTIGVCILIAGLMSAIALTATKTVPLAGGVAIITVSGLVAAACYAVSSSLKS